MKASLSFLCLAIVVVCAAADHEAAFTHFKAKNAKLYASTKEEQKRYRIFKANMDEAARHAAENPYAEFGATKFSDMTPEEFRASHGYVVPQGANGRKFEELALPQDTPLLKAVDWRKKGAVTPVKNQGSCGCCWSFSVTGSVEAQLVIAGGKKLVAVSEQNLVSCSPDNCNGGEEAATMRWIIAAQGGKVYTEESYPYVSGDTTVPKCNLTNKVVAGTITNAYLLPSDETVMQAFVSNYGPLSIAVDATSFQSYSKGVLTNCISKQLNHAVLVVGFDSSSVPPYWIVKNQWGADWGEGGYIRLAMFKNTCLINGEPLTAVVGPSTPQPNAAVDVYLCNGPGYTYCPLSSSIDSQKCCPKTKTCCGTKGQCCSSDQKCSNGACVKTTAAPTTAKPTPKPPTPKPTAKPPTAKPTAVPTTARPTTSKPTPKPPTAKPTPAPTLTCGSRFSYCQGLNVCCFTGYSCCTKDICCGKGFTCSGGKCVVLTPAPSPCTAKYDYCQGLDVCCPSGDSCCTTDFCCAAGSLCYDNECVSACDADYGYCPEQDVCCPADTTCCNEDECCGAGDICKDEQCVTPCESTYSYCDNLDVCCPDSTSCCSETECCLSSEVCVNSKCVSASTCDVGYNLCAAQDACCATGTSCCSTAFCCKSGYVCVNEQCVPQCDTGYNYCSSLDVCCRAGTSCCSATTCCLAGSTCSKGKCVSAKATAGGLVSAAESSTAAQPRPNGFVDVGAVSPGATAAGSLNTLSKGAAGAKSNAAPNAKQSALRHMPARGNAHKKGSQHKAQKPGAVW